MNKVEKPLHVSTRLNPNKNSTHNRRLPGVRDSSEPRRANARAELKPFRVFSVFRG